MLASADVIDSQESADEGLAKDLPGVSADGDATGFVAICGVNDKQYVAAYAPNPQKFLPDQNPFTKQLVGAAEGAIIALTWRDDFKNKFGSDYYFGYSIEKSNYRHCTGALIGGNRVLTAGHCLYSEFNPRHRNSGAFMRQDLAAQYLKIEIDYDSERENNVDNRRNLYSIIGIEKFRYEWSFELDGKTDLFDFRNAEAFDPKAKYGWRVRQRPVKDFAVLNICDAPWDIEQARIAAGEDRENVCKADATDNTMGGRQLSRHATLGLSTDNPRLESMVALIQHPAGQPKQIDTGRLDSLESNGRIGRYRHLDTLGGASGAPLLGRDGKVVGVHVAGGCKEDEAGNSNIGNGAIMISVLREEAPELWR